MLADRSRARLRLRLLLLLSAMDRGVCLLLWDHPWLPWSLKYLCFRGCVTEGAVFFSDRGLFVFSWGAADAHLLMN